MISRNSSSSPSSERSDSEPEMLAPAEVHAHARCVGVRLCTRACVRAFNVWTLADHAHTRVFALSESTLPLKSLRTRPCVPLDTSSTSRQESASFGTGFLARTVLQVGDDALELVFCHNGQPSSQPLDVESGAPRAAVRCMPSIDRWAGAALPAGRRDGACTSAGAHGGGAGRGRPCRRAGRAGGARREHRCQSLRLCSASSWREANTAPGAVLEVNVPAPALASAGPSLRAAPVRETNDAGPRPAQAVRRGAARRAPPARGGRAGRGLQACRACGGRARVQSRDAPVSLDGRCPRAALPGRRLRGHMYVLLLLVQLQHRHRHVRQVQEGPPARHARRLRWFVWHVRAHEHSI